MPIPSQTFTTIAQLFSYLNSLVIPNGANEITGAEVNNVLNGLGNFIINYTMNANLAGISSSTGVVSLSKPITVFTAIPTSIQWPDTVQNEYYITNATGSNIPLTGGYSYTDQYGTAQTVVPSRTSIHIAKATSGTWYQVNNLGGSGSSSLPPVTGHAGQALVTDGNSTFWSSLNISLTSASFQADGRTYLNATLGPTADFLVSVFWSDLPNFLYISNGDWQYVTSPSNGIKILNPAFNANTNPNLHVELFLKGING